jgi:hypothetical protein
VKIFSIDLGDELGLFIEEKLIFTKKKFRRSAGAISWLSFTFISLLSTRFLKDAFKLESFPFGSLK